MSNCANPSCNSATSKMQTVDGMALNYFHFGGEEWVFCSLCIKKFCLSVVSQLVSNDRELSKLTKQRLAKEAEDKTVMFEGQDESYVKLQVR